MERPPRRGLGPLRAMAAAIFPADQLAPFAAALTALRTELGCPGRAQTDCRSRGSPRSLRRPARSGGTCTPDASPALS
ncbi:hypothetical protein ACGFJT_41725 [Actinomadura geliboluensis]|uniref:hypothetical protein n=1 Tax=Actinomadura geliboluensis TaxID=882440 RepID=UPI003722D274